MNLIQRNNSLVQAKNKFVSDFTQSLSNPQDAKELFNALDEAFKQPELANRLASFNDRIKKFNVSYNPSLEKTKYVGGCTECRTMTEVVSRMCENYGCVQEYFTTNVETDDCNQFIVSKVNPTADLVKVLQPAAGNYAMQAIRAADDKTIECYVVPLVGIPIKETVRRDAMCSCIALDAMAEALLSLRNTMAKVIDRAILYGNFDSGSYIDISNFDVLDFKIGSSQKLTSTGELDLFSKIYKAVADIQDVTGCDIEEINILARAGLRTRMMGALDNNDRPIVSELAAAGISCTTLRAACANTYSCQSVNFAKNNSTGVVTTDVWVGMKKDYAFGKYMFPAVEPQFNQNTGMDYLLFQEVRFGGKLMDSRSYYKITATI